MSLLTGDPRTATVQARTDCEMWEIGKDTLANILSDNRPLLDKLFQWRMASFPGAELDHIQFLCAVDGARWAQDTDWKAGHSMRETIRAVLGE